MQLAPFHQALSKQTFSSSHAARPMLGIRLVNRECVLKLVDGTDSVQMTTRPEQHMWLQFQGVRGLVGDDWDRFGAGWGPQESQTGTKSTPKNPDRTPDNLKLQEPRGETLARAPKATSRGAKDRLSTPCRRSTCRMVTNRNSA